MYDYIKKVQKCEGIEFDFFISESDSGFYYESIYVPYADKEVYLIHVSDKRVGFFTKLTLRHEIGHCLFDNLWSSDPSEAYECMQRVKRRKMFSILQKFYYWNPLFRKIKVRMGYSSIIGYSYNDVAYKEGDKAVTHGDSELFADYFAVFGLPS